MYGPVNVKFACRKSNVREWRGVVFLTSIRNISFYIESRTSLSFYISPNLKSGCVLDSRKYIALFYRLQNIVFLEQQAAWLRK